MKVYEAIELERPFTGEKFFRITVIRDNEEVQCWEVKDNAQGEQIPRSVNSAKLSTFRWPFFAYVVGQSELIINPLAKRNSNNEQTNLHYTLGAEGGRITKIQFS